MVEVSESETVEVGTISGLEGESPVVCWTSEVGSVEAVLKLRDAEDVEFVSMDVEMEAMSALAVGVALTVVDALPSSVRPMLSSPYPSNWRKTDADAMPERTETPRSIRGMMWAETCPCSEAEPPIDKVRAVIDKSQSLTL